MEGVEKRPDGEDLNPIKHIGAPSCINADPLFRPNSLELFERSKRAFPSPVSFFGPGDPGIEPVKLGMGGLTHLEAGAPGRKEMAEKSILEDRKIGLRGAPGYAGLPGGVLKVDGLPINLAGDSQESDIYCKSTIVLSFYNAFSQCQYIYAIAPTIPIAAP